MSRERLSGGGFNASTPNHINLMLPDGSKGNLAIELPSQQPQSRFLNALPTLTPPTLRTTSLRQRLPQWPALQAVELLQRYREHQEGTTGEIRHLVQLERSIRLEISNQQGQRSGWLVYVINSFYR
jgi:hypothetical protein